ncbi:MAG: SRPBCC domain-containing protein [Pseudomonadota bacterium]
MNEPLKKSIRVRCPVAHAFAVFTGQVDLWWPRGHRRFDDSKLRLDPVIGGRFIERAADGQEAQLGEVVTCDPPNAIAYTWNPGRGAGPTLVSVSFAADSEGTLVEVLHSEGESELADLWGERVALFTRGWDLILPAFAAFAAFAEGGDAT